MKKPDKFAAETLKKALHHLDKAKECVEEIDNYKEDHRLDGARKCIDDAKYGIRRSEQKRGLV